MPLTKADVLAKVREYFSQPGAVLAWYVPCNDDDARCVYRGDSYPDSPVRCAIGCLIPDEMYDPEMEGKAARNLFDCFPKIAALFGEEIDRSWLADLQQAHDGIATRGGSVADFLSALDRFEATGEIPA